MNSKLPNLKKQAEKNAMTSASSSRKKKSACFAKPVELFDFMESIIQNKCADREGFCLILSGAVAGRLAVGERGMEV